MMVEYSILPGRGNIQFNKKKRRNRAAMPMPSFFKKPLIFFLVTRILMILILLKVVKCIRFTFSSLRPLRILCVLCDAKNAENRKVRKVIERYCFDLTKIYIPNLANLSKLILTSCSNSHPAWTPQAFPLSSSFQY